MRQAERGLLTWSGNVTKQDFENGRVIDRHSLSGRPLSRVVLVSFGCCIALAFAVIHCRFRHHPRRLPRTLSSRRCFAETLVRFCRFLFFLPFCSFSLSVVVIRNRDRLGFARPSPPPLHLDLPRFPLAPQQLELDSAHRPNLAQESLENGFGLRANFVGLIAEVIEEAVEELGKVRDDLQVRYAVQDGEPAEQESPDPRVPDGETFVEERQEAREGESARRLGMHSGGGAQSRRPRLAAVAAEFFDARMRVFSVVGDRDVGRGLFGDNVLEQAVEQFGAVLDGRVRIGGELTAIVTLVSSLDP